VQILLNALFNFNDLTNQHLIIVDEILMKSCDITAVCACMFVYIFTAQLETV